MEEFITRILGNLGYRATGPMHFRIYIQPLVAGVFAVLDGIRDAKRGWSPYFRTLIRSDGHRPDMIRDGWHSVGKVFVLAMVLDVIYQLFLERWIYPLEVLLAGLLLAIIPYVIVRGLVGRSISLIAGREKPKSCANDKSK